MLFVFYKLVKTSFYCIQGLNVQVGSLPLVKRLLLLGKQISRLHINPQNVTQVHSDLYYLYNSHTYINKVCFIFLFQHSIRRH